MSPFDWLITTPEAQGVASESLVRLLQDVRAQGVNLHTLHLARHNHLILDAYHYPYHADSRLDVRSIAKSITALVVGIALDEGVIPDLDHPVLDLLPGRAVDDPLKAAITVRHLLSMTSGLALTDADTGRCFSEPDAVGWALAAPMAAEPGTSFVYSSMNYYLLSALVQVLSGRTLADYAQEKLLGPLGMDGVRWQSSPQGITFGWGGLWLSGRDLVTLGQLVLDRGRWSGARIVPEAWIADITRVHAGDKYGLGWWIERGTAVMSGYGGRLVVVDPAHDLVIAITSGLRDPQPTLYGLIDSYMLPALHPHPLPDEPLAAAELAEQVSAWGSPQPVPVSPLPESARRIAGRRWMLAENGLGLAALTVNFGDDPTLVLESGTDRVTLPLGLDGVLRDVLVERLGPLADHDRMAATGTWQDDHTLAITMYSVNNPEHWVLTLMAQGDGLALRWEDVLTGYGEAVAVTPPDRRIAQLAELEREHAERIASLPKHSVQAAHLMRIEELEEAITALRAALDSASAADDPG